MKLLSERKAVELWGKRRDYWPFRHALILPDLTQEALLAQLESALNQQRRNYCIFVHPTSQQHQYTTRRAKRIFEESRRAPRFSPVWVTAFWQRMTGSVAL